MKYLAVDIGEKRIGIAVSDESGIIARPVCAIAADAAVMSSLGRIISEENPEVIVFGIPRHQNGEESEVAKQIRDFADAVKSEFVVQVDFEDESATTIEAAERLKSRGIVGRDVKDKIDAEAAAVILEAYIERA